ncbi:FAD binding domain-containing protein [Phthorimaea operculella]|nr:FAD binding domain-containing protein [Phthorimaea operculella]
MVITQHFKDLYDMCTKTSEISLPVFKENPLKIEFQKASECRPVYEGKQPPLPFADGEVFDAGISDWRKLTAEGEGCKDVYEVTFDITGSNFHFKPGDTIGIIPHNIEAEVNTVLSHIDLATLADVPYKLSVDKSQKGAKIPAHVPVKSTLRHVFTHCLDLRAVLKKLFILSLSKHTKDEKERKVLEYICSKEGSASYTSHILNKNMCILDLFAIYKTCKPPVEVLLANLPRLLPRPYSIASSRLRDPNLLKICFSVMDIGNNRRGLTTGWLEQVITSSNLENQMKNLKISKDKIESRKIPIYLRRNPTGFSMPGNLDTPLLLLGPGTGVAPFIGFLEERQLLKQKVPEFNLGLTWLFFGCRNPKLDFIYEKELNEFMRDGTLSKFNTAFSRVENSESKYIQDALQQNGEAVTKFIKKGAIVFVCGDLNNMASQIKEVLLQCLVKHDKKSVEDAEKYINDMQKDKRYFVDIWS